MKDKKCYPLYIDLFVITKNHTHVLLCGMMICDVCLQASTQDLRNFRTFSRNSGQSLAWPMWMSRSRNKATWLLISTMSCKQSKKKSIKSTMLLNIFSSNKLRPKVLEIIIQTETLLKNKVRCKNIMCLPSIRWESSLAAALAIAITTFVQFICDHIDRTHFYQL